MQHGGRGREWGGVSGMFLRMGRSLLIGIASALSAAALVSFESRAHAEDDLVAPAMSLARLCVLLNEVVSPPPTPSELIIVASLHREMVAAYDSSAEGEVRDAWRAGNVLYDELRNLTRDPSRARLKEVFRLQARMQRDADQAEQRMFEMIAVVLAADEADAAQRATIEAAVSRARVGREADRLLASLPMEEPSGARQGLREAVARLCVSVEVRAQLFAVLAERDQSLAPLVRAELREYESFAIAAAHAFDEVFGGVLPPLGAFFSDDEEARVRARMKSSCEREGEQFLAARRAVRALEDSTVERMCALLSLDEQTELRLRLSPSINGWGAFLLATEGHVRDVLRELPADDATRAQIAEFAPRWRIALVKELSHEIADDRARQDETFWNPSPWRASNLAFDADLGEQRCISLRAELDRLLAPRVVAAGGTLGNLTARALDSGETHLLERPTVSAWHTEVKSDTAETRSRSARLTLFDLIAVDESALSPEYVASHGVIRRGIAPPITRADIEARLTRGLSIEAAATTRARVSDAWSAYETRWNAEIEPAIARLGPARRMLRGLAGHITVNSDTKDAATARIAALTQACVIRDSAWRAAQAADEAFFDALVDGAAAADESLRQAVLLERFQRFIEREKRTCDERGFAGETLESYPQWVSIADDAQLDERAHARVLSAIVREVPAFAAGVISARQARFDFAASLDAVLLGCRTTAFYRSKERSTSETRAIAQRAAKASAAMIATMLDAAAATDDGTGVEQRTRLEHAMVVALYREWEVDPLAKRSARVARAAAVNEQESLAIEHAVAMFQQAFRASQERAARLALARSPIAQCADGRILFPLPAETALEASADRLAERLTRERRDLRSTLDIELLALLGRERWAKVAPPDVFTLHGVGGCEK